MNNPDQPPPNKEKLSKEYTKRLREASSMFELQQITHDMLYKNYKLTANFKFINDKWEVTFTDN